MGANHRIVEPLQIGEWAIDAAACLLREGSRQIKLTPRAMDVLVYLVERTESVVATEELLVNLWPHTVRSPNAVAKVMSELRQALEVVAPDEHLLETVPKRGYRLQCAMPPHVEAATDRAPPHHRTKRVEACVISMGPCSAVLVPGPDACSPSGAAPLAEQILRELQARAGQVAGASVRSAWVEPNLTERQMRAARRGTPCHDARVGHPQRVGV